MKLDTKDKIMIAIIGTILYVSVPISLYYLFEYETKMINEEARKEIGGTFVRLSDGYTHYELTGRENAETLVLIHGATMPLVSWDNQVPMLTNAGYQVLRYDRYGRGWSDRPHTNYSWDLYERQLSELLTELKIKTPVYLVGRSFGAELASCYAQKYPENVKKLIYISPATFSLNPRPIKLGIKNKHVIQYLVRILLAPLGRGGLALMAKRTAKTEGAAYSKLILEQMRYEGYERAMVSSAMESTLNGCGNPYTEINALNIPAVIISGTKDPVITADRIQRLRTALTNAKYMPIEGAGHSPNFTHTKTFNSLLLKAVKE